jgi:hypothetical protein
VPDEEEREVMRRIVEWHDAGLKFAEIASVLNAAKMLWKKPSKTAEGGFKMVRNQY